MTDFEIAALVSSSLILILGIVFISSVVIACKLAKKYAAEWEILNPDLTKRIREIDGIIADYNEIDAEIKMYKKEVDFIQNEMKYVLDTKPYKDALISYYSKIEVLLRKERDYLELIRERNEYVHQQRDYVEQKMPKWIGY